MSSVWCDTHSYIIESCNNPEGHGLFEAIRINLQRFYNDILECFLERDKCYAYVFILSKLDAK